MRTNRDKSLEQTLKELEDRYLLDPFSSASGEQVWELYRLQEEISNFGPTEHTIHEEA